MSIKPKTLYNYFKPIPKEEFKDKTWVIDTAQKSVKHFHENINNSFSSYDGFSFSTLEKDGNWKCNKCNENCPEYIRILAELMDVTSYVKDYLKRMENLKKIYVFNYK